MAAVVQQQQISQYQKVANLVSEWGGKLEWQSFTIRVQKAISQYRLRVDDELNVKFEDTLREILAETNDEVKKLLANKKAKIDQALHAMQSNDLSIPFV